MIKKDNIPRHATSPLKPGHEPDPESLPESSVGSSGPKIQSQRRQTTKDVVPGENKEKLLTRPPQENLDSFIVTDAHYSKPHHISGLDPLKKGTT